MRPDVSSPAGATPIRWPLPGLPAIEPPSRRLRRTGGVLAERLRTLRPSGFRAEHPGRLRPSEGSRKRSGVELESLTARRRAVTKQTILEPDTRCRGRVTLIRRERVGLGGRGILRWRGERPGTDRRSSRVARFNREDGLRAPAARGNVGRGLVRTWGGDRRSPGFGITPAAWSAAQPHPRVHPDQPDRPVPVENIEEFVGEKMRTSDQAIPPGGTSSSAAACWSAAEEAKAIARHAGPAGLRGDGPQADGLRRVRRAGSRQRAAPRQRAGLGKDQPSVSSREGGP